MTDLPTYAVMVYSYNIFGNTSYNIYVLLHSHKVSVYTKCSFLIKGNLSNSLSVDYFEPPKMPSPIHSSHIFELIWEKVLEWVKTSVKKTTSSNFNFNYDSVT